MDEYLERRAAVMRLMQDGCTAKNVQSIMDPPPLMLKKSQTDTTLSQTCMSKDLFFLPLLLKITHMHGKASGMKTAVFLSAEVGLSWALIQTKDVTHTTTN